LESAIEPQYKRFVIEHSNPRSHHHVNISGPRRDIDHERRFPALPGRDGVLQIQLKMATEQKDPHSLTLSGRQPDLRRSEQYCYPFCRAGNVVWLGRGSQPGHYHSASYEAACGDEWQGVTGENSAGDGEGKAPCHDQADGDDDMRARFDGSQEYRHATRHQERWPPPACSVQDGSRQPERSQDEPYAREEAGNS
jgi:hypothetical protein